MIFTTGFLTKILKNITKIAIYQADRPKQSTPTINPTNDK